MIKRYRINNKLLMNKVFHLTKLLNKNFISETIITDDEYKLIIKNGYFRYIKCLPNTNLTVDNCHVGNLSLNNKKQLNQIFKYLRK